MAVTKAAIYLRVSTGEQTTDNQRLALVEAAGRHGWEVVEILDDAGFTGKNGKRPAWQRLQEMIARKEIDLVAAWAVDRLGRSMHDLIVFFETLRAKGIDLYIHQQGIDTSTPAGKMMFQMMGVFAEFERSMLVERVKAGQERARNQGKVIGRPRRIPHGSIVEGKIFAMFDNECTWPSIQRQFHISHTSLGRLHTQWKRVRLNVTPSEQEAFTP